MAEASNGSNDSNLQQGSSDCDALDDRMWWVFILTSAILYVVLLLLSLGYFVATNLLSYVTTKRSIAFPFKTTRYKSFKALARQLTSGDTIPSQILLILVLTCNIAFVVLAVYRSYEPVERCFTLSSSPDVIAELIISLLLMVFFFIRFLASDSVIGFWFELYTIVDILTLPHVFVAISLGQDWMGLKVLRFIWLNQITDVLRFIPVIKSQDTVDIVSLLVRFGALWMTSAGIVHLIEVTGDPWNDYDNAQSPSFLEYVYFIMVTMSTVGYGDLFAVSDIGRVFMTFFIIGGLAFFAIALPALVDIAIVYYRRTMFAKFDTTRVPKHVIVCGHINASSTEEFLNDFLHPDRGDTFTHVLFLDPKFPEQEERTVLRSYYTRVQYIVGSVLNSKDLSRAKIHSASACFIIADRHCENPVEEDNANLLRLVSIKNTTIEVPVIIQVLRGSSKEQIWNIPGWQPEHDIALCLNELKLGLLAQSCICPGLSTLVANLFYTSDFPKLRLLPTQSNAWQDLYIKGASNEIYPARFSRTFSGMTFHDAVLECYQKLGLVLIAIEDSHTNKCYINPSPSAHPFLTIHSEMNGYFIGQDLAHVELASRYCATCHSNILHDVTRQKFHIRKCTCSNKNPLRENFIPLENGLSGFMGNHESVATPFHTKNVFGIHSCPPQSMDNAILNGQIELSGHIVVCIFANDSSPLMGLFNFVQPLRAKTIPEALLKPIVIITNRKFLKNEWQLIQSFPQIYLLPGSPLDWHNLEEAKIASCHVCVILTATAQPAGREHALEDKEAVLCSLSIQKHLHGNVRIITDLIQESNVQFLDISDEDDADARVYMAQPFACGEAFATSMFDSVTTAAFHSPGTLYLVEKLVGSSTSTSTHRCTTNCQVMAIPLNSDRYRSLSNATFGELYGSLLDQNCICLAITRELYPGSTKSYVITAPPHDMELQPTDVAMLLIEWTDQTMVQFC